MGGARARGARHKSPQEILGGDSDSSSGSDSDSSVDSEAEEKEKKETAAAQEEEKRTQDIQDHTEHDMINLRRTVYLTLQKSLLFEECVHSLMRMKGVDGQVGDLL